MQEENKFKNVGMHYKDIWKDENLKPNEKLVLIYLIDYYSLEYGYCHKTREQIHNETGIAKNTLNNVLKNLEAKGYITIGKYKTRNGQNNIYYIHKYLVVSKKSDVQNMNTEEAPAEEQQNTKEASTNELLVKERVKLRSKMTDLIREQLNELDTDILIKAIDRANSYKPEGYFIGYLLNTYDSVKNNPSEPQREVLNNKPSNNSSSNRKSNTGATTKPLTRYHGTFNEHFRNYDYDELEAKLLKMQNSRN